MNHKNYVLGTLSQDAFLMVNKKLSKLLGFVEAGLLAELISTHKYVEKEYGFFDEGKKGEWFYLTQPTVEERLGIKRREHDTAIKNLVKFEVIFKKLLGLPAKTHYVINWEKIMEFLSKNDDEPLIQSGCTKRTNKEEQNVQTRVGDSSIHTSKEKKELTKNNNKNKDQELVNKETENIFEENLNKKQEYDPSIENITPSELKADFFINTANEFYTKFAGGRWSKDQWTNIIFKLTTEILRNDFELYNPKGYVYRCLENIAYRHDLKHGKIEARKPNNDLPFYDYWLED